MELKYIQGAIVIAVLAFSISCIAIRALREWLIGPPDIYCFSHGNDSYLWTKMIL
jgi:hypothetical protein